MSHDQTSDRAPFAVVTVTYSPGKHLDRFVESLRTATTFSPEVILADNGSTDGAPERVSAAEANVRLLRTGANIGYGGAINRAVAEVDRDVEFVVIANPDVAWGEGALDELLAAARRWPDAAAFGPMIREPDGTIYPSAREVPRLINGAGHAILGSVWPGNPWTRHYRNEHLEPIERTVGWLSGSCILMRRNAFDEIHGFDSRYFMYMEDVDLGDRLGRAGWQNVFVPQALVVHTKGHAAGRNPELMLPAHHQSAYRFQADRHPHWWQAPLRWSLRAGLAMRSKVAVRAAVRERNNETTKTETNAS